MGGPEAPFTTDHEILLKGHSEKLEQMLRALLDIRANLDVKLTAGQRTQGFPLPSTCYDVHRPENTMEWQSRGNLCLFFSG